MLRGTSSIEMGFIASPVSQDQTSRRSCVSLAALLPGTRDDELTLNHLAATQPDKLRDSSVVAEFAEMMRRWILEDPTTP